jgi:DNA-binding response OmpR family regulator
MAATPIVKILVAEDDRDIAELITHYLRKEGWTPYVASAGEALRTRAATPLIS